MGRKVRLSEEEHRRLRAILDRQAAIQAEVFSIEWQLMKSPLSLRKQSLLAEYEELEMRRQETWAAIIQRYFGRLEADRTYVFHKDTGEISEA